MKRPIAFLLAISIISLSYAQTGQLEGIVTGADQNEGLVGVNIILEGTVFGTISGVHGDYLLSGIPVGTHTVIFSYIGYETFEREIRIQEDQRATLDVVLEPGSINLAAVTVEAYQPFSAASSKAIRNFDLKVKPVRSAQDVLSLVPGLFIAQHAGGGKAEQIFMRGFDADHGTDVGVYVDGLPVNMVTHGHGQGYADLHFIIPEIIEGLTVYKGPYFAQFGNFGTAGSVDLSTTDHPDHNLMKLEGGMFNTLKATTVLKIPTSGKHQSAYIAGQYSYSDGPFESPQGFNRGNIFGKFHTHITPRSELGIAMGAFTSAWDASGQIPDRAVRSGLIDRFGAIDDLEGGTTGRYNISVDYHFTEGYDHDFMVQAFMSSYDFKLYSNFTLYLEDPVNGDMIEQTDNRSIYGINTRYSFQKQYGNMRFLTRTGLMYRGDNVDLSLWKSPDRNRMEVLTNSSVNEVNMAMWVEEDVVFSPKFKLQLGLRGDYLTFNVLDHLDRADFPGNGLPHASGYAQSGIISPNLNLVWSPSQYLDIYVNGGTGFHSNDARDVVISARINEIIHAGRQQGLNQEEIDQELANRFLDPEHADMKTLPRAMGAELGLRLNLGNRVLISAAGWYLNLEEELVYVGDAGTTEISGESRRIGADVEIRAQLADWIWGDVDVNFADGRYPGEPEEANYIPLAPRLTAQGGVNFQHPTGLDGALRFRYLADRPANEDNSVVATGHTMLNAVLGYRFKGFRIFAQVENILNMEWNEAQFDTESRLFDETEPVSELHYTPGNPFNVQLGLAYEF
jgi:outer membrane receptor protein involved in Fe transport